MTPEEMFAVFGKHFQTAKELDSVLGMLKSLLNKQVAGAKIGQANVQAAAAAQAAEAIRQAAQAEANQADAEFAALVAAAAAA